MNVKAQWIAGLALALAAAAAVVGAAQATRPEDRPGLHGAAPSDALRKVVDAKLASAPPDAFQRAVNIKLASAPPDAFQRAVNIKLAAVHPRPDDRAGVRGLGLTQDPPLCSSPGSSGFQWRDAAVGAGATIGLLALGGILLIGIRRRTHVALP